MEWVSVSISVVGFKAKKVEGRCAHGRGLTSLVPLSWILGVSFMLA